MDKKIFWFSFAGADKNLGVLQLEAKNQEEAIILAKKVQPEGTIHTKGFEMEKKELPEFKFYSPEEMVELGYAPKEETIGDD